MLDKITAALRSLTPAQKKAFGAFLAALIALLAAFGINLPTGTVGPVTVTVNTAAGPTTITATPQAVQKASEGDHNDLGGVPKVCGPTDTENCVTSAELAAGLKQTASMRGTLPEGLPPAASTSMPGCKTRQLRVNYSSRNGVKPDVIFWHQTISADSGLAGINGNIAWFSNPGAQVSIHFIIDGRQGHCAYTLPMTLKAWHVTGFNSRAIGIEVTGNQTQGYYVKGAGRTRLAVLTARIAHTWGIPVQRAILRGCVVVRPGIADHDQGGACAGGHNDITPYRSQIPSLIALTKQWEHKIFGGNAGTVTYPRVAHFGPKRRAWCNRLATVRAQAHDGGWTPRRTAAARRYKQLIGPGQSRCRLR